MDKSPGIIFGDNVLRNLNTLQSKFNNPNLFDEFFFKMRELRTDKSNCDICLNVSGSKIHAHKNVLAGGTPYFYNMFYGPFTDRQKSEITIGQIDFGALEDIVDYFYSGDIKITAQNVKNLFQASDRIQVDFVKKKCIGVISQITTTENCFDFWDFAESYNCDTIRLDVFEFMFKNFDEVIKTEEFTNLSYNQINTLMMDKIFKRKPKELYTGVLEWVKHNLSVRQHHFYDLIKSINFKLMDKTFVKTYVANENLMKKDHKCLLILAEILFHQAYPEEKLFTIESNVAVEQKLQPCIFVSSSVQDQYKSLTQIYNPYIEYIKMVKSSNIDRNFAGITCQKGILYIAGGRKKTGELSKLCNIYNIATNEWSEISSMDFGMELNALVSHGGNIYSIGCAAKGSQIYNPTKDTWTSMKCNLRLRGAKCSADVIGNRIYVVNSGSIYSEHKLGVSFIEAYDTRTQNWESFENITAFDGNDASCAAIDNKLYISRTDENKSYLSEFDVRLQKPIPLANMAIPRPCHDLIKYGDHLYAIGGKDISTVEEYDIKNDCWSYVNSIKGSFAYVQAVVPDYDF